MALFVALAQYAHFSVEQGRQAGNIKRGQFGQAQTGGIKQFEDRLVANFLHFVMRSRQQAIRFVGRQNLGQMLGDLGRTDAFGRIGANIAALSEPAIKAAPGRQNSRQGTPAQAARVQLRNEAPNIARLQGEQITAR